MLAKVIVNNKKIITWTVNVIEPEVHTNHIGSAIILDTSTGEPFATECEINAIIDLVKIDGSSRFQLNLVERVADFR